VLVLQAAAVVELAVFAVAAVLEGYRGVVRVLKEDAAFANLGS